VRNFPRWEKGGWIRGQDREKEVARRVFAIVADVVEGFSDLTGRSRSDTHTSSPTRVHAQARVEEDRSTIRGSSFFAPVLHLRLRPVT